VDLDLTRVAQETPGADNATEYATEFIRRIEEASQQLNEEIYQQASWNQYGDPASTEPPIPAAEEE